MRKFLSTRAFLDTLIRLSIFAFIAWITYRWHGNQPLASNTGPSEHFPIVLHRVGSEPSQYVVTTAGELAKKLREDPSLSLALPTSSGFVSERLPDSMEGNDAWFSFSTTNIDDGQRIHVERRTTDYNWKGRYRRVGTSWIPEHLFIGHPISVMLALLSGACAVSLYGYYLRYRMRESAATSGRPVTELDAPPPPPR